MNDLFLFDSDTFITAYRDFYNPDFCPQFWQFIKNGHQKRLFFSIDKVKDELDKGTSKKKKEDYLITGFVTDELLEGFWWNTKIYIDTYRQVIQWGEDWVRNADGENTRANKRKAFEHFCKDDIADAWLVAATKVENAQIVTFETSEPNSNRAIKIPDAAQAFEVETCSVYRVLEQYSDNSFQLSLNNRV